MIFSIPVSSDKKIRSIKFWAIETIFMASSNLGEIAWFANFNQRYLHSRWSDFHNISIKMFRKEIPFKWHQIRCCLKIFS